MYLDNAATTKMHPEVIEVMSNVGYANYNAKYYEEANKVHKQIDNAITSIATNLQVEEKQLVFTSCASESNNYIIKGIVTQFPGAHFITSTIEHKCVLETFKYLETLGFDVTYVKPNNEGVITSAAIEDAITPNTKFASIMYVNNETGVINDMENLSKLLHSKDILFHTDAVQAIGKLEIDYSLFDYVSLSAHKIYGPKGIGLAIISNNIKPIPLIHGSEQQNNNRAGTLPNELIMGFAKAIELSYINFEANKAKMTDNREKLVSFLDTNLGDNYKINFTEDTIDNILSIQIKGQINQIFLNTNSDVLAASTGSSCSINSPSYVLKECSLDEQVIRETIRVSLSFYDEIEF